MADNVITLTMIVIVLSLLFGLVGAGTTVNKAMGLFGLTAPNEDTTSAGEVVDFNSSTMAVGLALLFIAAAGSVIFSGLTGRSPTETVILSAANIGIMTGLVAIANDFVAILSLAWGQGVLAGWIGSLILIPLYGAYLISIIKFWRGTD